MHVLHLFSGAAYGYIMQIYTASRLVEDYHGEVGCLYIGNDYFNRDFIEDMEQDTNFITTSHIKQVDTFTVVLVMLT